MTSSAKQCRAGVQERGNTYPVKPVGRRRFRWAAIKCVIVAQGNLKHLPRTDSVVVGMKYIASVSFGKDSLAMLLRLIAENYPLDAVVFYDTGMEFQAIYDNRDKAAVLLQNQGITFVELHPSKPFLWDMLERPDNTRDGSTKTGRSWCGGLCRWGTAEKREALNRYYKTFGGETIVEYVGIAADERQRIHRDRGKSVKLYPLVEWNMTEAKCLQYCYDNGWHWQENGVDLYDLLDRVSCWCCRNKNKRELYNIWHQMPDYWQQLKALQSKIAQPFKDYGSIFELEKEFAAGWQPGYRTIKQDHRQMEMRWEYDL